MIHKVWEDFSNSLNFRAAKLMPEIHMNPRIILKTIFLFPCPVHLLAEVAFIYYFHCLSQHCKWGLYHQYIYGSIFRDYECIVLHTGRLLVCPAQVQTAQQEDTEWIGTYGWK